MARRQETKVMRHWGRVTTACAGLLMAASVFPFAAGASSLAVSPTALAFAPNEVAKGLVLHNRGNEAFRAQVRVFVWDQPDGNDRLEPTDQLVASPPFVTIPPGAQHFVRIVRRQAPSGGDSAEESYRLLVDELPASDEAPPPNAVRSAPSAGLRFLLRYSIPVFVNTPPASHPELTWATAGVADDMLRFAVTNTSATRAQIADVRVQSPDGSTVNTLDGLVGYVLPGVTRIWSIPWRSSATTPAEISARINGEPRDFRLSARDPAD
ncbi:molecular chaperone [Algiphilus sp. NNCM1]|uniref:fimbrial biogenesis chaperone n=1 Tax=Algiphilus sp. TaxID=1872431 RepID=UPI001CA695B3|nr:fimbria/pilus periplasmic chaperone [Algiphilus sp.]MBY8964867.1 molecular chaperone [Algiphilus acroporae]MCI5062112.1 fimbria/pilus periplasmic chaperone [Algiphilus sp.]MCI5102555.1 fimbria/pilus periplasmic chaperone [Algiphilus sp.]